MKTQDLLNYERIARAIDYLKLNFRSQPTLEEIAAQINLSPFHFQRLFSEWAGVSPKQFIAYLTVTYAKNILRDQALSLFDAAIDSGLSGTGRLHDLFVKVEGMTPGEFKNGGEGLKINFSFNQNLFGSVLIASTTKGVCYMAFIDDDQMALADLKSNFPNAHYVEKIDEIQQQALKIFNRVFEPKDVIKVHLKGTDFQLKVWNALLKIPGGSLTSYGQLSEAIGSPKASRAVGSTIGHNPVAFIIPCHRVIQSTGSYGQYRWGSTRKSAMIAWEAASLEKNTHSSIILD